MKDKERTGYEKIEMGKEYYPATESGIAHISNKDQGHLANVYYNDANYYNNKTLAKNIAKADKLFRQLRQWQALNDEPVDWNDTESANKCFIFYNYEAKVLAWSNTWVSRSHSTVYFSSQEKAEEAIEEFRDELLWYFTEYQSRLDEPKRGGQEVNT